MKIILLFIISAIIIMNPKVKKTNIDEEGMEYDIDIRFSILGKGFCFTIHRRYEEDTQ